MDLGFSLTRVLTLSTCVVRFFWSNHAFGERLLARIIVKNTVHPILEYGVVIKTALVYSTWILML
jgi:hypothetical protein